MDQNTRRDIGKIQEGKMAIDIMAINKISFMITRSRNINFGTAKLIRDKTNKTLMTSIQQVIRAFHARDLKYVKY